MSAARRYAHVRRALVARLRIVGENSISPRGIGAPQTSMSSSETAKATLLLRRMSGGDDRAAEELMPLVYGELHALAARFMGGHAAGHTLQPTALVNEAWLRLIEPTLGATFENRAHFLGVAARAMRSVLVDHARRRGAQKRGGAHERVPLEDIAALFEERASDLLALDEALTRLSVMDPQLGRIVELRFFGGLSVEETAGILEVSEPTIVRGWRVARMWLKRELGLSETD
jgi:RNA polymerase sigma factor (TIGR02999 family)